MTKLAVALVFLGGLTAASAQTLTCNAPQKPMMDVELLFGRNVGDKLVVTEKDWAAFLTREVTPRFPDGLTVFDTSGQMRSKKTKAVMQEPGKIVRIIMGSDPQAQGKIDAIVAAYKMQFRQESVGVVMRPACVSF
jgi:Protein of unknown function (DUF3574)